MNSVQLINDPTSVSYLDCGACSCFGPRVLVQSVVQNGLRFSFFHNKIVKRFKCTLNAFVQRHEGDERERGTVSSVLRK